MSHEVQLSPAAFHCLEVMLISGPRCPRVTGQAVPRGPLFDDEHRGLIEVGVHNLGDVGVEAVAVRSWRRSADRSR